DEYVMAAHAFNECSDQSFVLMTNRGACKRMMLLSFEKSTPAKRGQVMLRELKTTPHRVIGFLIVNEAYKNMFQTTHSDVFDLNPQDLTVSDRHSNGSFIIDSNRDGEVVKVWKKATYTKPFGEERK